MSTVALIVSTYNQPEHLDRCLFALGRQTHPDFELLVADDGSAGHTRSVVDRYRRQSRLDITHLWQEDRGFRKTRILNKAILTTGADYLIFMDGDCVAHPDFVKEHLKCARAGHYLNGTMVRLDSRLSDRIDKRAIAEGDAFRSRWLTREGGGWNRRYLKFSLNYSIRCWLNRHTLTKLYWLGANSSCFRKDAVAVNGFDNRFSYGFEDVDFGHRLENYGLGPLTVRWTASSLHLFHGKPWDRPEDRKRNLALVAPKEAGGRYRAQDGLAELERASG